MNDGKYYDLDSQSGVTQTASVTCAGGILTFFKPGTYKMTGEIGSFGSMQQSWGTVWMQFLKEGQYPNESYGNFGGATVNRCPHSYTFDETVNITSAGQKYYFAALCVYMYANASNGYFAVKDLTIVKTA